MGNFMGKPITFDLLLDRIGGVLVLAVVGPELRLMRREAEFRPIELEARAVIPCPMPPDRLPPEVRDGLITRRHLEWNTRPRPLIVRGFIEHFDQLERVVADGIKRSCRTWGQSFIKPTIIVTAPCLHGAVHKRAWLELLERAGARRVFLTPCCMTLAVGMKLDLVYEKAKGIVMVGPDCSEFAVIGYVDELCEASIPIGLNDLAGPDDPLIDRLAQQVLVALEDLRPLQLQAFQSQPCTLLCDDEAAPWLASALGDRLGATVVPGPAPMSAMVEGLMTYARHLRQWAPGFERVL